MIAIWAIYFLWVEQARYRGHAERVGGKLTMSRIQKQREMDGADVIAAGFRGHIERMRGESVARSDARNALRAQSVRAATALQSIFRGHRGRSKMAATSRLLEAMAVKKSAVKIFLDFDINKDGAINKDEFRSGVETLGLMQDMEASVVDSVFDMLDDDGSGELSLHELVEVLKMAQRRVERKAAAARARWSLTAESNYSHATWALAVCGSLQLSRQSPSHHVACRLGTCVPPGYELKIWSSTSCLTILVLQRFTRLLQR